jgi:hypothetical protein
MYIIVDFRFTGVEGKIYGPLERFDSAARADFLREWNEMF